MSFDNKKFIEELKSMSVLELNELVKSIEEEFGVSAAMPVASGSAENASQNNEPTEVDVILTSAGNSKIPVVKAVQSITGLGLKDAKGLVDKVPSTIKEKVNTDEAEKIKKTLEEVGASVELK